MLAAALIVELSGSVSVVGAELDGVKHRIDAVVTIERTSPLMSGRGPISGAVALAVRVSANSRESRYFGTLTPTFTNASISEKGGLLIGEAKIWEEDACHQRRGMPKVTVTRIGGMFTKDGQPVPISSTVRHIGIHLPIDELTPGMKLPEGMDGVGQFYAVRARTRDTQINADLKIYTFNCVLPN